MTKPTHKHRPRTSATIERCYKGPVAPYHRQNRGAHGNVERSETCGCGARRLVLVNGRHREASDWQT